jgi:fluoride exporter
VITLLLVSAAGGVGAVARYLLDTLVSRLTTRWPLGTFLINVSGSLLLGLVTGLAAGPLPVRLHLVLGTGFLGGYTTFSTASVDTVRLLQERRRLSALVYAVGMLALASALATVGLWLGLRF